MPLKNPSSRPCLLLAGALSVLAACDSPTGNEEPPIDFDAIVIVAADSVLAHEDAGLALGGRALLRVFGLKDDVATPVTRVRWTTSDASVLGVDEDGMVSGRRAAVATVTAQVGELTASRTFGVWQLDSIYIHHAGPDIRSELHGLVVGDSVRKATHYHIAGTMSGPPIGGISRTWSSSNPAVATIDSTGMLRAHAAGEAVITVRTTAQTVGPDQDTQRVVVVAAPLTRAVIDDGSDASHRLLVPVSGMLQGDMPRLPKVRVQLQGGVSSPSMDITRFERLEDGTIRWSTEFRNVAAGAYEVVVTAWDSLDLAAVSRRSVTVVDPVWAFTQQTYSSDVVAGIAEDGYAAGRASTVEGPQPVRWRHDERVTLARPFAGDYWPSAVNRHGVVVGRWDHPVTVGDVTSTCRTAVRWRDAQMELLLGEESCTQVPVAMNDRGDVLLASPAALLTAEGTLVPLPSMTPVHVDEQQRVVGTVPQGDSLAVVTWRPGDAAATRLGVLAHQVLSVNDSGLVTWRLGSDFGLTSAFGAAIPYESAPLIGLGAAIHTVSDDGTAVGEAHGAYYVSGGGRIERIDALASGRLVGIRAITTDGVVWGTSHPHPQASVVYTVRLTRR